MHKDIKQFLEKYRNREFDDPDVDTQLESGWVDWHCDRTELRIRLRRMCRLLTEITDDFVLSNFYVRFANCQTEQVSTYDSILFIPCMNIRDTASPFALKIYDPKSRPRYRIRLDEHEIDFENMTDVVRWLDELEKRI